MIIYSYEKKKCILNFKYNIRTILLWCVFFFRFQVKRGLYWFYTMFIYLLFLKRVRNFYQKSGSDVQNVAPFLKRNFIWLIFSAVFIKNIEKTEKKFRNNGTINMFNLYTRCFLPRNHASIKKIKWHLR